MTQFLLPSGKQRKFSLLLVSVVILVIIALVAILWSQGVLSPNSLPFSEDTEKIEAADASVVTIYCYDYDGELAATGSGFVAFDSSTIITNYHVMTSAYTCKISTNQEISYEVSNILCYSKEQDIAILQLAKDTGLQPLTLGDSGVIKKGETVVAIGSPLGIKNTVSTGVLSGRVMEDNMDVLQFTAPISSGSSGGALFDNNGNVIGITYASYIDGQNLNLAIPIELAYSLYNSKGTSNSVSTIYTDEHPYVTELLKFNNVTKVTIDELLKNPELFNEKTIMVTGYFSSSYTYLSRYSNQYITICYISPKSNITGDGELDYELENMALKGQTNYQAMSVAVSDDIFYLDDSIRPGDPICWIGEISYWKDSQGNVFFNAFTDLCFCEC